MLHGILDTDSTFRVDDRGTRFLWNETFYHTAWCYILEDCDFQVTFCFAQHNTTL
jgi:hypothetical protein